MLAKGRVRPKAAQPGTVYTVKHLTMVTSRTSALIATRQDQIDAPLRRAIRWHQQLKFREIETPGSVASVRQLTRSETGTRAPKLTVRPARRLTRQSILKYALTSTKSWLYSKFKAVAEDETVCLTCVKVLSHC